MMRPVFILFISITFSVWAGPVTLFEFETEEQEATFNRLSNELRCMVCQNQSIADSNADLAKDLREEIYNMIKQGKSEQEIVDFMVQRYGDYVLYNPPMRPMTWLLWFGPAIIFVLGLVFVARFVRAQKARTAEEIISSEEIERLKNLQAQSNVDSSHKEGHGENK